MIYFAKTDKGRSRENNEDSFLADMPVFVVADGMGGHAAGELASKLTVNVFAANRSKISKAGNSSLMAKIAELANSKIIEKSARGDTFGMGTTLTALSVKKNKVYGVHAGDSRAYLISDNHIEQLTKDHTFVNELVEAGKLTPQDARMHPNRNIITKALGVEKNLNPDVFERDIKKGDILILASDGLTSMLDDSEIHNIVLENKGNLSKACDVLVEKANELGGVDNITVILVDPFKKVEKQKSSSLKDVVLTALEFLIVTGMIVGILLYYLSTQYYIQLVKNEIVLFQGHPQKIFNFTFSRRLEGKKLTEKGIPDWYVDRLEEGISVNGIIEGRKTLSYVKSFTSDAD